jgi:predicted ATP-grasp superfamily ATP-dependent carboligase
MRNQKIETFGLTAIQSVLTNAENIETARAALSCAECETVDVCGKIEKRVRRDEQCKLVIKPDNATMQVFADFKADEQTIIKRGLRKGSNVSLHGKLLSFGYQSVCLTDCYLGMP